MNSGVSNPVVSVIVPARNEESCLALCLESLVAQTGIDFEIIVVDDASSDLTVEIAKSFAISVISAPPLPENWTGKNNAMSAGAKIARGKWLLFTDADTSHKPGSLGRAVAEAEANGAALLSYSPEQEVRGFWEKAVMPVIFAELAAVYPPNKVNDPASPIAAANGQYLLISRETYDAVGGHTSIASDLLEDVAMARLVKSSGQKIIFRYGGDAVRTRMYRSWSQMKEGWTKNLVLLFRPISEVVCWRMAEVLFIGVNLAICAFFLLLKIPRVGVNTGISGVDWGMPLTPAVLAIILWLMFLIRIRKAHFSLSSDLLAIFGLPVFTYLLMRSARSQSEGKVTWKNRSYSSKLEREPVVTWAFTRASLYLISAVVIWLLFITSVILVSYNGYLIHRR